MRSRNRMSLTEELRSHELRTQQLDKASCVDFSRRVLASSKGCVRTELQSFDHPSNRERHTSLARQPFTTAMLASSPCTYTNSALSARLEEGSGAIKKFEHIHSTVSRR